MRTCVVCGAQIASDASGAGRPAKYCSSACRQRAFRQRARSRTPAPPRLRALPLPQALDPFIGREPELRRLRSLLSAHRLVTLVGPGGVGKTRLAMELAHRLHRGRVWLIELDSLHDGELLLQVVSDAFGLTEQVDRPDWDALAETLGEQRILVVLDNCEHLITACAAPVDLLLRRCGGLRVLATSRQALGIAGEMEVRIDPLPVPAAGTEQARASVLRSDAVRLFLDRAQARAPQFALSAENAGLVVEICRHLDGLPLAIELAARRVGTLPLTEILSGLDNRLALLTEGSRTGPDRHRELRAAIEWSYQLLDSRERAVFRRLSVLVGGFDERSAAVVCAGCGVEAGEVAGIVRALRAKSLVVNISGNGGGTRFRQLHSIRAYGIDRLGATGELASTRDLAAGWLAGLALPVTETLCPPDSVLRALRRERENLVAAVGHTAPQPGDRHVLLGLALARVWQEQDRPSAARQLLTKILDQVPESAYRSDALAAAAGIAARQRDLGEALRMAARAVDIERARDRPAGLAGALDALAFAHLCRSEYRQAIAAQRECVAIVTALGRELDIAVARHNLAWQLLQVDASGEAELLLTRCLPAFRGPDTPLRPRAAALHTTGTINVIKHNLEAAARCFTAGLYRAPADSVDGAPLVEGLAIVAAHHGEADRAVCLAAAAEATRRRLGVVATDEWRRRVRQALTLAEKRLNQAKIDAATAAGGRLRGSALRAYALRDTAADPPREPRPDLLLTAREQQIVTLVADGATNREIGEELNLSAGTVTARLTRILGKLDLRSRTQLAVWAVSRRGEVS